MVVMRLFLLIKHRPAGENAALTGGSGRWDEMAGIEGRTSAGEGLARIKHPAPLTPVDVLPLVPDAVYRNPRHFPNSQRTVDLA